ncbi:ArsR/SmtB family transcription factor [Fructilactobacillus florum]|nr:metalloregulator ArsR/SmtB family transcription factor [Fructilactobacillus florum]EKK20089.1 transcriptional regulator, ArsR family [Fructilactobacillus florum 2F]
MISIDSQAIMETSAIFKLLGNETRLNILLLLEKQPQTVSELVSALHLKQSNVSHQLAQLKHHQLIASTRRGKNLLYSLRDPHVITMIETTYEHSAHVIRHEGHPYPFRDQP